MADFSQIEQNYLNDRSNKANRDAYKIVLISRIDKDRFEVCRACNSFKKGLSPSRLWQSFLSSGNTNSVFLNKLLDMVKVYPYISLYAGKRLLKLGKAGSRSTAAKAILFIVLAKMLYNRFKKEPAEPADYQK